MYLHRTFVNDIYQERKEKDKLLILVQVCYKVLYMTLSDVRILAYHHLTFSPMCARECACFAR